MKMRTNGVLSDARSRVEAPAVRFRGLVHLLRQYRPPYWDMRFWATQALVAAIAGFHDSVEWFGLLPHLGTLYFVPISLFFVPVVYAALNFGLSGSVATALWCTVLSVPNFVVWHSGGERFGVMFQMAIINCIAVFVGNRVDKQMKARADAEAASRALQVSETKYRGLFETSGEGVLVVDRAGRIVECNAAASALLRISAEALRSRPAVEVLPAEIAAALGEAVARPRGTPKDVLLNSADDKGTWVEPLCTPLAEEEGSTQVVLRDVTEQKRHQAGLETYAAQIVSAQEEERRRVAQELHDETVQSLVLLCRKLDAVEAQNPGVSSVLVEGLRETRGFAESTVESLRGFIRGLRPATLDDLGLTPAVRRLVSELSSRSPVKGELVVRGRSQRLPAESELALFRIAQEALHNVERHSQASRVKLTLSYGQQKTKLVVADDGSGFSVPATLDDLANENKLGLMGMQERAKILGGKLVVHSAPGCGTTVIVELASSRDD
jgi:two-component system sensor histidine kinase DegS